MKEGQEFATLTDIITKAWSDKNTKKYKVLKGLKKENLRDNMTNNISNKNTKLSKIFFIKMDYRSYLSAGLSADLLTGLVVSSLKQLKQPTSISGLGDRLKEAKSDLEATSPGSPG